MYQSNTTKLTEEDFTDLTNKFEQTVFNGLKSIPGKFNMNSIYIINHACIWNKVDNVGKKCKIIQKNDKLALVKFNNLDNNKVSFINLDDLTSSIYRLEDLTILNYK
jgi:hypothetical protein